MRRSQQSRQAIRILDALLLAALGIGCDGGAGLLEPPPASLGKANGGGGGGGKEEPAGREVVPGDLSLSEGDAPALASTCPTDPPSGNGWDLWFGKSLCLIVEPLWASTTYDPYPLLDDIGLRVIVEKGKDGRITHVKLGGQDVDGEAGIAHETDWVPVAEPVVPSKAGFTLHVHATNVPVWRLDSHLAKDGERVEIIGTVSIGDLFYPPQ